MASPKEGNMDNSVAQSESAAASASTQSLRRSSRTSNQVISPNQNKHESSITGPAIRDNETPEGGLKSNSQEKLDTSKTQSASSNPKAQAVDNEKDLGITDDVSFSSSGCDLFGNSDPSVFSTHDKHKVVTSNNYL
jgi:hypothetical protein